MCCVSYGPVRTVTFDPTDFSENVGTSTVHSRMPLQGLLQESNPADQPNAKTVHLFQSFRILLHPPSSIAPALDTTQTTRGSAGRPSMRCDSPIALCLQFRQFWQCISLCPEGCHDEEAERTKLSLKTFHQRHCYPFTEYLETQTV